MGPHNNITHSYKNVCRTALTVEQIDSVYDFIS